MKLQESMSKSPKQMMHSPRGSQSPIQSPSPDVKGEENDKK
jgi:hypothetical protein